MSEVSSGAPRTASFGTWAAVAVVFALLVGLGTWQMQRRTWKEALLRTIAERQIVPPATVFDPKALGCDARRGLDDPCDFRPVRLAGRMAAQQQRHVFIAIPRQKNGLEGVGYWVFSPFLSKDGNASIWVNRGFVPEAKKNAFATNYTFDVVIEGVLRRAEERGRHSGANDLNKNIFYVRSPAEFDGTALPSYPTHYIDMTGPVPDGNLPYPMAGRIAIPNRHLEYALTWYGLAVTWLVIAFVAIRRRRLNGD